MLKPETEGGGNLYTLLVQIQGYVEKIFVLITFRRNRTGWDLFEAGRVHQITEVGYRSSSARGAAWVILASILGHLKRAWFDCSQHGPPTKTEIRKFSVVVVDCLLILLAELSRDLNLRESKLQFLART